MPTDELLRSLGPEDAQLARHTGAVRDVVLTRLGSARRSRRHLWPTAALTVTVVAALAVGSGVVLQKRPPSVQRDYEQAAPRSAYLGYGAFSVGRTLFIGNHRVRFAEKVKSLYYTSAGVLVRHGDRPILDDSGPSRYTLVRPDGTRRDLHLDLGERVPGTSPRTPYLAYAAPGAAPDHWVLRLVDVRSGRQLATTTITGAFTWGGWLAPPVATDGGRVWALLDAGWVEWESSTGAIRGIPRAQGVDTPLESAGGRYLEKSAERVDVRDFATGQVVAGHSPDTGDAMTTDALSPDGRALLYGQSYAGYNQSGKLIHPPRGGRLLDLASGRFIALTAGPWGWTPDGSALKVDAVHDRITTCSSTSGRCSSVHETVPAGRVKLGGASYES